MARSAPHLFGAPHLILPLDSVFLRRRSSPFFPAACLVGLDQHFGGTCSMPREMLCLKMLYLNWTPRCMCS